MPHSSRNNGHMTGELNEHFISRSAPDSYPFKSCDLMSLDYFLWTFVKAHEFASIDGKQY